MATGRSRIGEVISTHKAMAREKDPTEPTRFSAEEPLPKSIWEKWLQESYDLTTKKQVSAKKRGQVWQRI